MEKRPGEGVAMGTVQRGARRRDRVGARRVGEREIGSRHPDSFSPSGREEAVIWVSAAEIW
jgi:hypothetical protein